LRGKEIVEREIKKTGFTTAQLLKADYLEAIYRRYTLSTLDDLYAAIGYGGLSAGKIVPRLRDEHIRSLPEDERTRLGYRISPSGQVVYNPQANPLEDEEGTQTISRPAAKHKTSRYDQGVEVKGIDNCLVRLSRCCSPVPGDPIIGFVTRGKGVAVHRTDCSNIRQLIENSSGSAVNAEKLRV